MIPVCNDKRNECIWCLIHDDWFNSPYVNRRTKCDCDPKRGKNTRCESRCARPTEHQQGWFIYIFRGGRGCIAGETRIYNPETESEATVEELYRRGRPSTVLALTEEGARARTASVPFIKGRAKLYRVVTDSGREISVTDEHRFLTPKGWQMLSQLRAGDSLAVGQNLPASISGVCPSTSLSGAPRSSRIASNWRGGYRLYVHFDDLLPLPKSGNDLSETPLQGDAHERNYACRGMDAQANESECNRPYLESDRLARSNYAEDAPAVAGAESCLRPFAFSRFPLRRLDGQRSLLLNEFLPSAVLHLCQRGKPCAHAPHNRANEESRHALSESLLSLSGSTDKEAPAALSSYPAGREPSIQALERIVSLCVDFTMWERIRSIEYLRTDVYYDLTVEGEANYLANGIWNHNTGKTAQGREITISHMREYKTAARVGIGGASNVEARKIAEGDQGIITHYRSEFVKYNRSPGLCEAWHENGAYCYFAGMDAEDAKAWNGENLSMLWTDEVGLCREEVVKQAILCVRKGDEPFVLFTGTPKRAKWLRELERREDVAVRFGETEYNDSLPEVSRRQFYLMFAGTSYERSELKGQHVEKVEGALWDIDIINKFRRPLPAPGFISIGWVALDPAVSNNPDSNATGISAGGIGVDNHLYVFGCDEVLMPVEEWAEETIMTLDQFSLDRVVGEKNNGGDLVESVIASAARARGRAFHYEGVWASRGKVVRAEPAAQLMKLGLVHHCGTFQKGEEQLTEWQPGENSPNALDSYVWLCKAAEPYLLRQFGAPVAIGQNQTLVDFTRLMGR